MAIKDNIKRRQWLLLNLPPSDYKEILTLQEQIIGDKAAKPSSSSVLIMVEHLPVFTLGNRGGRENLKVSEDFLGEKGIKLVETKRGGNITFHGPGQLVAYPLLNLKRENMSIPSFVENLEEIMLRVAADFKSKAKRSQENRGIWVGDKKLGSVGIAIRRGITYHGLALNVCPDLTPFSWINPCGLNNMEVTSLSRETETIISLERAKERLLCHFKEIFGADLITVNKIDIPQSEDSIAP